VTASLLKQNILIQNVICYTLLTFNINPSYLWRLFEGKIKKKARQIASVEIENQMYSIFKTVFE